MRCRFSRDRRLRVRRRIMRRLDPSLRPITGNARDLVDEALDRVLPILEQVYPLPRRKFVGKGLVGCDVFDPNRDHDKMALPGQYEFLLDLVRVVGIPRKDQNHHFCGPNGPHDRYLEIFAGFDVARRNPAGEVTVLEGVADCHRNAAVFRRITDEDWGNHGVFEGRACTLCAQRFRMSDLLAIRCGSASAPASGNHPKVYLPTFLRTAEWRTTAVVLSTGNACRNRSAEPAITGTRWIKIAGP